MPWEFLANNLPHVTASLNAVATVLLVMGLLAIRQGKARKHKKLMLSALSVSMLFLVLYLFHKFALYQHTGAANKPFRLDASQPLSTIDYTYYSILISHILLAITVPFITLRAVYLAQQGRIIAHKKWVRYAYPIWMYVSVTGVLVYLMLYQLPH